jgi:acylphosphatase
MTGTEKLHRKHILIAGRVQGVGYRYSMRHQARELRLTGWCRNLPDGRVEAEVFGHPEVIEKLVQWCHQGPPHAGVSKVLVVDLPVNGQVPETFDIRP